LLAIAAVALRMEAGAAPRIDLADSFEAVLHHESPSTDKENILLHGIGVAEQRAGAPPAEVLAAFERWSGAAPRVAYHAAFDRAMIERGQKAASVGRDAKAARGAPEPGWLDLAPVASALYPETGAQSLDDWLEHFRIACVPRHQAAADALATAELLLRLWPAAQRARCTDFAGLRRLERDQRWLDG
jgi:DNA polymerase-3 subunit epsilon